MKRRVRFLLRMQKQQTWARFTILCLFSVMAIHANSQNYFNRLYDYNGLNNCQNHATTSIELSNGDYLIGGNKFFPNFSSLYFIRLNSNGDTVLAKRYPNVNNGYYTAIGNSLIRCYDGNFVQCGVISDTSYNANALLVKLTENGDTLWTKNYGGVNFDNANMVCQTSDSGFVLMGVTQSFSNGPASDFYLIKTDKNGNFQWQHSYGTTAAEDCYSGQQTLDGGFVMSGIRNNLLYVLKVDVNGVFQWDRQVPNTAGSGFIKQLADSTYILVGARIVTGLGAQAYMAKLSKIGVVIWQQTYGGTGDQQFYAVPIILNDGSIVCSGTSRMGNSFGMLIKTDSIGNQLWLRTYYANANNDNYVYDVKHSSDNGFILTGSGNLTGQDAWVVKVDSNGCEFAGCNVGIEELGVDGGEIGIYPNPATNEIMLATNQPLKAIHIYNVLGEEVLKLERIATSEKAIDVSTWKAGVYFLEVETEKGVTRKKLVKE